jgi:hypothetical protein
MSMLGGDHYNGNLIYIYAFSAAYHQQSCVFNYRPCLGVLDTVLHDKACKWAVVSRLFSPVSTIDNTD